MLVWIGYDNNKIFDDNYSYITKNIFADTMSDIQDNSNSWYETPKDVVAVLRDAISGEAPKKNHNTSIYYYLKGSEPEN